MSAVATEQRAEPVAGEVPEPRLFDAPGPSLEDRVLDVWDELVASGRARCPVCRGTLRVAGGCEDCGSELF